MSLGSLVLKVPKVTEASLALLERTGPKARRESLVRLAYRVRRAKLAKLGAQGEAGEAGASAEALVQEKVLRIVYWQAPTLPGSYLSGGTKDRDAGAITLEPLAKYDPLGNIVPALAREIPTALNGGVAEDFTSITWTLRDGLKWSDGTPLTAADVVFNLALLRA